MISFPIVGRIQNSLRELLAGVEGLEPSNLLIQSQAFSQLNYTPVEIKGPTHWTE